MKALTRIGILSLIALSSVTAFAAYGVQAVEQPQPAIVATRQQTPLQAGVNRVTFESEGETLVGNLYLPVNYQPGDRLPAVVVSGAWISVKEQMAGLYAQKLAEQGFAALAFDSRYYGESGGTPRQFESPEAKVEDIKNAITYLQSLPSIDGDRISGLDICFGAGYMAKAATEDSRLKSFATVAAWLHDAATLDRVFGSEVIDQRMQAGLAAERRYAQTGEVETVRAFATETDPIVAMTGEPIYYGNPERGSIREWRNEFAVKSWVGWIQFEAMALAPQVNTPALFVHSDGSALPENVKQFYSEVAGPKQIVWLEGNHFDFYDQVPQVNQAVEAITEHFQAHQ
jgi:fermentation-respiration switch protein FrsA (DUF1100 family)